MQAFFSRKVPSFHARGKKRAPFGVLVRRGGQDARGPIVPVHPVLAADTRGEVTLFNPFPWFDRAAGFPSSRPQDANAGARRVCQGWPHFCGHPGGRPGLGLDTPEHDGTLNRSGPDGCTSFLLLPFTGSIGSAGCIVLYVVELSSPHHGLQEHRRRNVRHGIEPVAKRIARSPRPVPAGTTFRREGSEWA